ncbi:unnamed protein product [Heligmosomoides polygyrus]|uniref:DDE_Tnp_1_7 domain-containing protein n=1 Tax=Heligmosomoides polygyrus TaxID=6339 RepID=A0A183FIS0_HELPZ|nr:unnamed protein product [Heligmosomoides polygyrus]
MALLIGIRTALSFSELEQKPPFLQAELEREGIDTVDELEDEEEGPNEWWDGLKKACENGLDTLIANGIFSMHPNPREKNGQLYTIHGVCNGKVNVPLLYAITNKKTEIIYATIWTMLKGAIDSAMEHVFNPRV